MADRSNTDGPGESMPPPDATPPRQAIFRLLRRLFLYHAAMAATLAILLALFPTTPEHLPIGGVRELASGVDPAVGRVDHPAPTTGTAFSGQAPPPPPDLDRLGYARRLAVALVGTWLLMLPVSWVQKGVHRGSDYDHSLDETTLILPGVVAAIVLVVQYSLALAFALAGIVAGVQFRRALQDTFDALFILVAIGCGIAAGVGALEVAAVMTVFFCYATLYVCRFGDGFESDYVAERKEKKRQLKAEHEDQGGGSRKDPS
ncbi:hypothetical protein [Luteimonas sp. MC1782]|uniref:hypothetical protein n=1 Tax=Luteimonas sp. MC1782 TaxID=2760305 RepID=UPI001C7266C0|nr:hypothetical protein [Luteimonas sp. MC1782]